MKTSEVELLTGVSKQTLYFYEDEGMLSVERDQNNYRNYSEEDVQRVQLIRMLRDFEVSIDDVRMIIGGSLSLNEALEKQKFQIEKKLELNQKIKEIIETVQKRKIPLLVPFEAMEHDLEKTIIGYWRTSDAVSIGRRMTRASLLRSGAMGLLMSLVFVLSLRIGIPKMMRKEIASGYYFVIFFGIILLYLVLFFNDLLATGSPYPSSRFNVVEVGTEGIRYNYNQGFWKNINYVLRVLRNSREETLNEARYESILSVVIKPVKRFMSTKLAVEVITLDFEFKLEDGTEFYLVSPILLDGDAYWIAQILSQKVRNVDDKEQVLSRLIQKYN